MSLIDYVHPMHKDTVKRLRSRSRQPFVFSTSHGRPLERMFSAAREIRNDPHAYAFPRGNWSNEEIAAAVNGETTSETLDQCRAALVSYVAIRASVQVPGSAQAAFLAVFRDGAPENAQTLDASPAGLLIIERAPQFRAMLEAQIEAADTQRAFTLEMSYEILEDIARTSTDDQTRTEALRELDVIAAIIGHRAVARQRSEQRRMKERAAFKLKQSKK